MRFEPRPALLALALSIAALVLGTALPAPAQPQPEAPSETQASFRLPQAPKSARALAIQLPEGAAVLNLPEARPGQPMPAVLVIPDALGADGRADAYVEQLLGADIAVLELRGAHEADARLAWQALLEDPRFDPAKLGILGFGEGAQRALDLPGSQASVLLYPGCASLPRARRVTHAGAWARQVTRKLHPKIRDFLGPTEYARDFHAPWAWFVSSAPPHGISFLLAHGTADPANTHSACTSLAETLRGQGALVEHRQFPGAGYAWDYPQLGAATEVLLPAPGRAERLPIRPWPALAAQTAAEVAGFFAQHFSEPKP
jgi:dienelactone hydrolase